LQTRAMKKILPFSYSSTFYPMTKKSVLPMRTKE